PDSLIAFLADDTRLHPSAVQFICKQTSKVILPTNQPGAVEPVGVVIPPLALPGLGKTRVELTGLRTGDGQSGPARKLLGRPDDETGVEGGQVARRSAGVGAGNHLDLLIEQATGQRNLQIGLVAV